MRELNDTDSEISGPSLGYKRPYNPKEPTVGLNEGPPTFLENEQMASATKQRREGAARQIRRAWGAGQQVRFPLNRTQKCTSNPHSGPNCLSVRLSGCAGARHVVAGRDQH